MTESVPSPRGIRAQAEIAIDAAPERVAGLYRSVDRWHEIFPVTIERASVVATGEGHTRVEVTHKQERRVANTLTPLSGSAIWLEESKPRFEATFLNEFLPAGEGRTRYVITGWVRPRGVLRLLRPFIKGYVRRQALERMRRFVLEPIKAAAESRPQ